MSSSLSNFVDNLSKGFHSDKYADSKSCLDHMMFKNDQLIFSCFDCQNKIRNSLIKN